MFGDRLAVIGFCIQNILILLIIDHVFRSGIFLLTKQTKPKIKEIDEILILFFLMQNYTVTVMATSLSFLSTTASTASFCRPVNPHHPSTQRTFVVNSLSKVLTQDDLKKIAASKAVEYVKSGMVLGLGTGSTAAFVVAEIGELYSSGKFTDIVGVPTSKRTYEQALSLGIPLSTLDDHPRIDLAIDGADEVSLFFF